LAATLPPSEELRALRGAERVGRRLMEEFRLAPMLLGRWPNPWLEETHSEQELRLTAALEIVVFGEGSSMPPLNTDKETLGVLVFIQIVSKKDSNLENLLFPVIVCESPR